LPHLNQLLTIILKAEQGFSGEHRVAELTCFETGMNEITNAAVFEDIVRRAASWMSASSAGMTNSQASV
jgi:hypothetical protein